MPTRQKRLLLILAAFLFLQTGIYLVKYSQESGRFGGDFIVFWHAAKEAVAGDIPAIYGKDKLTGKPVSGIARDATTLAGQKNAAPFAYPPHVLLALWPLGFLSYNQAVFVWSALPLAPSSVRTAIMRPKA